MSGNNIASYRRGVRLVLLLVLALWAVGGEIAPAAGVQSVPLNSAASNEALPLNFERHTDDLDAMVKRKIIRAFVLYSRTGFFYVDGRPAGIYYESLRAFEQFVNEKLRATKQHVQVTFIPVRPDKIELALTQGVGDLIAFGLVVSPEREQRVTFSIPIQTDVQQIVVTGKRFGAVSSLQDLGGKKYLSIRSPPIQTASRRWTTH